MKISRVEIIPVDIPYKIPFRVSYGGVTSGSQIILRILTDEGIELNQDMVNRYLAPDINKIVVQ